VHDDVTSIEGKEVTKSHVFTSLTFIYLWEVFHNSQLFFLAPVLAHWNLHDDVAHVPQPAIDDS
jgi:hypothetical protein